MLDKECLRINSQKIGRRSSEPILSHSSTFIPSVGRNLITQPPVKDVQPVATSSFDEEKQHEPVWMAEVNNILYVDCDTEKKTLQ